MGIPSYTAVGNCEMGTVVTELNSAHNYLFISFLVQPSHKYPLHNIIYTNKHVMEMHSIKSTFFIY